MAKLKYIVLFLLCKTASSQNIVPNPSFELNTGCPSYVAQISKIVSWSDLANHTGSADYFNPCATHTWVAVPNNAFGNQTPATGNVYVGLILINDNSNPNFREYIETRLTTPMVADYNYSVSFKYSLGDKSSYATDDFGIYFSPFPSSGAGNSQPLSIIPQLTSPTILNNKNGWTTITLNYIASGGEEYMLLGNFLNDATTSTTYLGAFAKNFSYIYLDDISVIQLCINPNLGNDTTICPGDALTLEATMPNASLLWQDNSTSPTYSVTEQGSYWVEATVNNCVTRDTINVIYDPVPNVDLGNDRSLCEGEALILNATTLNADYLWQDNSTNPTYSVTQQGSYWVKVNNNCGTDVDTLLIELENCNCILYIPDAFSPNGDEQNDILHLYVNGNCIMEIIFSIYDRWGEKVFETNDVTKGWDGLYKGKTMDAGIFMYSLIGKLNNGTEQVKKGNVSLLR